MPASSRGVGELIMDAYGKGCRHFIIGLGGTATCDGGMGMMSVPGLPEVLSKCEVELLCDVKAPFLGPQGAARVFAPQKGASPEQVELLEERMLRVAADIKEQTGIDISFMPCAGAAGGIAGALMAYAKARVCAGVERVMELCGFFEAVREADLIITGEGKSDTQTLMGKVPYGVLKHAAGKPVALFSGRIEDKTALKRAGFHAIEEVSPRSLPLDKAMDPATALQNIHNAILNLMANSYICI
jgi:glycerate kinase